MPVKKPIAIYEGQLKVIQPSDQTPGESAAAVAKSIGESAAAAAKSFAGIAEFLGTSIARRAESQGLLDNSLADRGLSIARLAGSLGEFDSSLAEHAASVASRSISLARLSDLQSVAHLTSIVARNTSLAASEAERAQSIARLAIESADISEAASVAQRGASLGKRAESIGRRASSLAHIALDEVTIYVTNSIYIVQSHDEIIICDRATPMALYFPAATGSNDRHTVKNINRGLVTVWADGTNIIDGSSSISLKQWDALVFVDYAVGKWAII